MASQAICSSSRGSSFQLLRKPELVAQMMVSAGGAWAGACVLERAEGRRLSGRLAGRQAGAVAKGHPAAAPAGVHQGRAPGLPEDAHSEKGHARLHLPGVSFPPAAGGPGRGAPLCERWALNSRLSSLEPALEGQAQADLIHSCLHGVMAVLPEPEGVDGHQEVKAWPRLRVPVRGWQGHCGTGRFSRSSPCTWTPCRPSRTY